MGTITNYVTSMMEVQAHFEKGTKEYKALEYRIGCGQLYQQSELDKLKGIVTTPMPRSWYNMGACSDNKYLQSICAYRKPYFMIYVYDDIKREYKKYISESNSKCQKVYNCSIQDLYLSYDKLTDEQKDFLWWYEFKMPVGTGDCAMNRICRYIEDQLDGYKSQLRKNSSFDYNMLKVKRRCSEEHRQALLELERYYCDCVKEYKCQKHYDKGETNKSRHYLYRKFNQDAKDICPDDEERLNIILDIAYGYKGNKQFCWDTIGELICKRLEELNSVHTE